MQPFSLHTLLVHTSARVTGRTAGAAPGTLCSIIKGGSRRSSDGPSSAGNLVVTWNPEPPPPPGFDGDVDRRVRVSVRSSDGPLPWCTVRRGGGERSRLEGDGGRGGSAAVLMDARSVPAMAPAAPLDADGGDAEGWPGERPCNVGVLCMEGLVATRSCEARIPHAGT